MKKKQQKLLKTEQFLTSSFRELVRPYSEYIETKSSKQ